MKIFISWSGEFSRELGECFRTWLPGALQMVKPYFTPSDIEKGARWHNEISKELETSEIGIFCMTSENLESSWLLFEAGALSNRVEKSHICPILFDIETNDLPGPLRQFQATPFKKTEIKKLTKTINSSLSESKLDDSVLNSVFEMWWPKLEKQVNQVLKKHDNPSKEPIRNERQILEEVLELSRLISKNVVRPAVQSLTILDLLSTYIQVYNSVDDTERYQVIINRLRELKKPIFLLSQGFQTNPKIRKMLMTIAEFNYTSDDFSEEDIPF